MTLRSNPTFNKIYQAACLRGDEEQMTWCLDLWTLLQRKPMAHTEAIPAWAEEVAQMLGSDDGKEMLV